MPGYTDLLVRTGDPKVLDETLQQLPMALAVVVDGTWESGPRTCTVRVFGNAGFVKFALANQGYGKVLSEETHA